MNYSVVVFAHSSLEINIVAMNGAYGLGITIRARQRVNGATDSAGRALKGLGNDVVRSATRMRTSMEKTRIGVGMLTGSMRGLRGMFSLAQAAGAVEQELVAVQKIMGVTNRELERLEKSARNAGMNTQYSSLQASQALRSLAQAGLTSDDAMKVLTPSLDLAAASLGKLSPTRAAGVANAALKAFGMQAGDARKVVNALVNTTNRFNVSIQDLPIGVGNISRGVIALKQNMNDSLIALGLVKNVLPNISKAGTLTSSAMLRIADPTIQKKLKHLGVTFKDSKGDFLPFVEIVHNLDGALSRRFPKGADRAAVAVKLLGKRGIVPFNIITRQLTKGVRGMDGQIRTGTDAINFMRLQFRAAQGDVKGLKAAAAPASLIKFAEQVKKSGGAAGDFVSGLLGTFSGQVTLLSGAWGILKETVGKSLAREFKPFVALLFRLTKATISWLDGIPAGVKRFVAGGAVMVGVFAVMTAGFFALKLALLTIAPLALSVFAPFIVLGLKSAALAAMLSYAWTKNMGNIQNVVGGIWKGMKEGWNVAIKPLIDTVLPELRMAFLYAWNAISDVLKAFGLGSTATTTKASQGWVIFGKVIGWVAGFVVRALGGIIFVVAKTISLFAELLGLIARLGRRFTNWIGITSPSATPTTKSTATGRTSTTTGATVPRTVSSGGVTMPQASTPGISAPQLQAAVANGLKMARQQPLQVTTTLNVDGRQMAQVTKDANANTKGLGYRRSGQGG